MKKIIIFLAAILVMVACKETSVQNDDAVLPGYLTTLKYDFGLCDSSWNFSAKTETIYYRLGDSRIIKGLAFYKIRTDRSTTSTFFGEISPNEEDFILNTPCLLPFIDTSWTNFPYILENFTPKNYSGMHYVLFAPFQASKDSSVVYDTTVTDDLTVLKLVDPNGRTLTLMTSLNYIQALSSVLQPKVKFEYAGKKFDAKCVQINFTRMVKPKLLKEMRFPRPSADTTINEFYLDNDNTFVTDKIVAKFYYYNRRIIEIRIRHSTVYETRLYKWRLQGATLIEK